MTGADRLSEAEVDELYRRWLQKTSFTYMTAAVESILAARLAEKDAEIERLRESGLKAVELAAYGRDCNRVLTAERDAALAAVAGIEEGLAAAWDEGAEYVATHSSVIETAWTVEFYTDDNPYRIASEMRGEG